MRVKDIEEKIPEKLFMALIGKGLDELRPPQELAIKNGLLEGKNMVVASPTASGKTIVAEIACVKNVLEKGGKAIYLTPLKALAHEKYSDMKEHYGFLNVMLSVGDFDSTDPWLEKADIIVCSNEKLDSLIRHSVPWLSQVNTIIIDEIHVLDQADRGPTLEVLITRLKEFCKDAQIIALSATIKNAKELSEWLNATLIKSDYRPVQLEYGIYLRRKLYFEDKEVELPYVELPEHSIIIDTLKKNKQILLFLSTRRNAEAAAKNAQEIVYTRITKDEKEKLAELSSEILNVLDIPTKQCEILSECVKHGTAFHHAGLIAKQHRLIEESFKKGILKVICATPTLAYGCNLPSHTVLVRDLKRYSRSGFGSEYMPVLEVQQMFGRAGRPQYDKEGRALMIAKSETEKDELFDKYVKGEPEEVYSKLSAEPILRMQVLGLVATGEITSKDSLLKFFSKTFFAHQYKNMEQIESKLERIIEQLVGYGFLTLSGKKILPTILGKRVAELYIDPDSANMLIEKIMSKKTSDVFWLHTICLCREMFPLLRMSQKEFNELQQSYIEYSEELGEVNPWNPEYDNWINAFKTALMLNEWINEKTEAMLFEQYKETPGVLRNRIFISDWLLYSVSELARIKNVKEIQTPLRKLRLRVQTGVKEELLSLLQLEGIGRVRARKLFKIGIESISDLRKTSVETIAKLLGTKVAQNVKKQVDEKKEEQLKLE